MGRGINYDCACGYSALIINGPLMSTGDAYFVGATCDTCRELVSVPRARRSEGRPPVCEQCQSPVRLFRDQGRICCPRCGRDDAWAQRNYILVD
jgi:hypothetical protein